MTITFQWWFFRFSAVLILPVAFLDVELFIFLSSFFFLHFILGLQTTLNDYLHIKKTQEFFLILLKLLSFEFLRYLLEFFF